MICEAVGGDGKSAGFKTAWPDVAVEGKNQFSNTSLIGQDQSRNTRLISLVESNKNNSGNTPVVSLGARKDADRKSAEFKAARSEVAVEGKDQSNNITSIPPNAPKNEVDNINFVSKSGTSPAYILGRLKRDAPELAKKVVYGELSSHAAAEIAERQQNESRNTRVVSLGSSQMRRKTNGP